MTWKKNNQFLLALSSIGQLVPYHAFMETQVKSTIAEDGYCPDLN